MVQPARFPDKGRPRPVEDFVYYSGDSGEDKGDSLCRKWRRGGGCSLNRHFLLDDEDPDNPDNVVWSRDMFRLMLRDRLKNNSSFRTWPEVIKLIS